MKFKLSIIILLFRSSLSVINLQVTKGSRKARSFAPLLTPGATRFTPDTLPAYAPSYPQGSQRCGDMPPSALSRYSTGPCRSTLAPRNDMGCPNGEVATSSVDPLLHDGSYRHARGLPYAGLRNSNLPLRHQDLAKL